MRTTADWHAEQAKVDPAPVASQPMATVSAMLLRWRRKPRPGPSHDGAGANRAARVGLTGAPAPPLAGVTPDGMIVEQRGAAGLVLFLTSTCLGCRDLWAALGEGADLDLPDPAALTVVTPDPSLEDRRGVATLAPGRVPVLMSTATWEAYRVAVSPWVALVVSGTVRAEGPVGGWDDVAAIAMQE